MIGALHRMGQNSTHRLICACCPISPPLHQIADHTKSPVTCLTRPIRGRVWNVDNTSPGRLMDDAPQSQGRLSCLHLSLHFCDSQHPFGSCEIPSWVMRQKKDKALTHSCFKPSMPSFNLPLRASTSRLSEADCVRMAAVSARVRVVISVRISASAARKRYACCSIMRRKVKKPRPAEQRGTYVVEIFVREPVTFDFAYAINEQGACCAHEIARGRRGERLFEHAKESMGIEGRVLVGRRLRRCFDS